MPRSLPFSSISRPTAVKAVVGVGLVAGLGSVIALQASDLPSGVPLPLVAEADSAAVLSTRAAEGGESVSRSNGRQPAPAVSAAVLAPPTTVPAPAGPPQVVAVPRPTPTAKSELAGSGQKSGLRDAVEAQSRAKRPSQGGAPGGGAMAMSGGGSDTAYIGEGRAKGLRDSAARVYSAVRSKFGITNIGGYRAGDSGDHGSGRAVDVMVAGSRGAAVADWAIANMDRYSITYVIYKQRIYLRGKGGWRQMEDRGSATQNHMDHVHISVG